MLDTESGDLEIMSSGCQEATEGVVTAEISQCVRDADFDGVSVETGDFIGFVGKNILACSKERKEAAKQTIDKLDLDNHEICIIIKGEDADEDECAEIENYVSENYRSTELFFIDGGQQIYSYIIVAE
jgi:dihydroxyacetone kinase-like predicted kinase